MQAPVIRKPAKPRRLRQGQGRPAFDMARLIPWPDDKRAQRVIMDGIRTSSDEALAMAADAGIDVPATASRG